MVRIGNDRWDAWIRTVKNKWERRLMEIFG